MGLGNINKYKLKNVYRDKLNSFIDKLDTETKKNIENGSKEVKW